MQGPANWDNPELARDIEKDDERPTTVVQRPGGIFLVGVIILFILVLAVCVIKSVA